MSLITKQTHRLRALAKELEHDGAQADVVNDIRRAADIIEMLAAKVRGNNNEAVRIHESNE